MFLSKPDLCYLFKSFIIIFSASQHNFSWVFLTLVVFNYCNAFSRFNTLILIFFEFLNSSSNCNMSLDFIKDVYITLQETFLCYPASSWLKWIGLHFSFFINQLFPLNLWYIYFVESEAISYRKHFQMFYIYRIQISLIMIRTYQIYLTKYLCKFS